MAASLGGGCSQIILMCCDMPSWGPVTLTGKVFESRDHPICP